MAKVTLDRKDCIGCQACMSVCDKYFKYNDDDNKIELKGAGVKSTKQGNNVVKQELEIKDKKDLPKLKEAEDICPVSIIHVQE